MPRGRSWGELRCAGRHLGSLRVPTGIRGEGDAKAITIYAEAFQKDPEFYGFLRTLEAYKTSLKTGTTLLLPSQSEFLEHLFKN